MIISYCNHNEDKQFWLTICRCGAEGVYYKGDGVDASTHAGGRCHRCSEKILDVPAYMEVLGDRVEVEAIFQAMGLKEAIYCHRKIDNGRLRG